MVPTRNEAVLSDSDPHRPELPDPQHDRHVAFPDDDGIGRDGSAAGAAAGAGTSLPPEAWAPRPAEPAPSVSSWQPNVPPGSVLTTPPNRAYASGSRSGNGSRGAKVLAALVLVPVMLGFFSGGFHDDVGYTGDGGTGVEMPMGGDMPMGGAGPDPVFVRSEPVVDAASIDATLLEGQPTVLDVPADSTVLRVEVVGAEGYYIDVESFAAGQSLGSSSSQAPYAEELFLDVRPATLTVTARTSTPDPRTLQCRIYADDILVAVDTGTSDVTCSPRM